MNKRVGSVLHMLISLGLGAVFIYSGSLKILDPTGFAQAIANYKILPDSFIHVTALYLPWLEVLCGLSVLIPRWQKAAILLISGMTLIFMLAVTSAMLRSLDISCGCFGSRSASVGMETLWVDAGILFGCYVWLMLKKQNKQ